MKYSDIIGFKFEVRFRVLMFKNLNRYENQLLNNVLPNTNIFNINNAFFLIIVTDKIIKIYIKKVLLGRF